MLALLRIVFLHRRVILAITAAGFIISAAVSMAIPSRYTVATSFLPLGVERDITGLRGFFAPLGSFGESFAAYLRARKNYIIDFFIRSRRMSEVIDAKVGLKEAYGTEDPDLIRERLQLHTRVIIRNEGVIILTVDDRSRERALAITNAYLKSLDSLLVQSAVEGALSRTKYLNQEVARREREIAASDSLLKEFLDVYGLYDMNQQVRLMLDVVSDLSARLSILDIEKNLLELTMKPGSPDYDRVELEWNSLREQLLLLKEKGAGPKLFPPLKKLPEISSRYAGLLSQRRTQEFVLAYLRVLLEDAKVSAKSRESVLRPLDPPALPDKRSWPKRKQIVLASTAASFFWGCLFLIARERWRDGAFGELRGRGAACSPPKASMGSGEADDGA
jgi:capsule polysaccharide export protein KpsE/RkpR